MWKSDVYGEWYLANYQVILEQYGKYLTQKNAIKESF